MNSKASAQSSMGDAIKWISIAILVCAGIVANIYFREIAWSLRLAAWIILMIIVAGVALQTVQGRQFQSFAKDARVELRKVVWPTRKETVQFTAGVVVMVVVMALALWLIDSALLWIVKWFTG
jgi:preprotein translocase subunit SecE